MAEFEAKVRRIGTSLGVLIPHQVVSELGARPGTRVRVVIPAQVDWSEVFGKFSSRKTTQELIRAARTDRD